MRTMTRLYAAVTLATGVATAPFASAQSVDAGLGRQQQLEQERQQKKALQAANKEQSQATKQERQQAKHEKEQLGNMPKPVRETLRTETANGKTVDYYRVESEGGKGAAGREFGAKFVNASGHQMDIRVDREGKVLSRQDLTAAAAAAQAPATAAQTPAPAPATPAPATPAPATPSTPTASTEAPESGNAIYRRYEAAEVPQNIRAIFDKDTAKASDVRYYRTKYGSQLAWETKYTDASGKEMRHYVSDAGQTLVQGEVKDDDNERVASAADRHERDRHEGRPDREHSDSRDRDNRDRDDRDHRDDKASTAGSSSGIQTGRAELADLPRAVQTQMRRLTEGGKDVKFYKTKYGSQQAYEAKFTGSNGKDNTVYLDESGKVIQRDNATSK